MKVLHEILAIYPDQVDPDLFRSLCEICPTANPREFSCVLAPEDPRLTAIMDLLRSRGYRPWDGFLEKTPEEFWLQSRRVYNKQDLEAVEYLHPRPKVIQAEYGDRLPSGLLEVEPDRLKRHEPMGIAGREAILVSDGFRRELERSRLRHLIFQPIRVAGRQAARWDGALWELGSEVTLPPLSSHCRLMNNKNEPFDGDYSKGCFLSEPFFEMPELHYPADAIRALDPFDLARTRERFGNKDHVAYPWFVASQHFYQFCTKRRLKIDWIPVRLDSPGGMSE